MSKRHHRSLAMDVASECWIWLGAQFRRRPLATLGVVIGCLLFVALGLYTYHEADQANKHAQEISRAFCNGRARKFTPEIRTNCRALLTQLLRDPSSEQVARLREIVSK